MTEPRPLLVIAHPGHELRVHGWLEARRPEVWVLTDGSGRTDRSRIDSTTRVLHATGGVPGPVYGEMTDTDLYRAVLQFEHSRFTEIVAQLAARLMRNNVDCIAGDAAEGYNPAHDICRLVINAATRLAKQTKRTAIANYDFALVGPPGYCPAELRSNALRLDLDDDAFARKISAARNYSELQAEVDAALNGAHDFRVECLRPVNSHGSNSSDHEKPYYEEYGERQVKAGFYSDVLRYREHMLPLAEALDAFVESKS